MKPAISKNYQPKGLHLPVSAEKLIPHRKIMLLIDELYKYSPEHVEGTTVIKPENPFLDSKGRLESAGFIELMAQLAAAGEGYKAKKVDMPIKTGYLAGVNNLLVNKRARVGDRLQLKLDKTLEMNNVSVAKGGIYLNEESLATGELKFYVQDGLPLQREVSILPRKDNAGIGQEIYDTFLPSTRSLIYRSLLGCIQTLNAQEKDTSASGEFCFGKDFPGFQGHFPEYPVLPGVVMIDISMLLCEAVCQFPLKITKLERAKFVYIVLPGDNLKASVTIQHNNSSQRIRAKLTLDDKPVANIIIHTEKDE